MNGYCRSYQELFSYQFLFGGSGNDYFDGGYLTCTNQQNKVNHFNGKIKLTLFDSIFISLPINLKIEPCEEVIYRVAWKDKNIYTMKFKDILNSSTRKIYFDFSGD